MSNDSELYEFLELVDGFGAENRPVDLSAIALKLKCHVDEVDNVLKTALKAGLIERSNDLLRLTDRGRLIVKTHREHYVHKEYEHGHGLTGRVTELLEGRVRNWRGHWHKRHGFDDQALEYLYRGLGELKGRIEETSTLADLRQGEKGVVAFALGGHGLVRRLSEMGLTPGTEVTVVRSAPLHGPVEVKVRGVSLALGRGVASKIIVKGLERDAESGAGT
jgi:Fe2+ transport system protein FeoA